MSELSKLRNENEERVVNLPWTKQKQVERIVAYLKTFELPEWELQTVFKDLIGMAEEAEALGISLQEQIGDEEAFCKAVIGNVRRRSRIFNILSIPAYLSMILFVFSIIGGPPVVKDGFYVRDGYIYLADFLYYIAFGTYIMGAGSIIKRYTFFMVPWKRWTIVSGYVIVGSLLATSLKYIPVVMPLFRLTPVVTLVTGTFGLLFFLLYYRSKYKRRKSTKAKGRTGDCGSSPQ